ncbi:PAS domain S-box protein [Azospirillum sp. SYSU D00513]|uniref:PAS domain S-box protein n=1 Tax=Azospirillum sp. SYSU D00513 TaxID=2812561 RepID=UPI001A966CBF|nr:PAS domain S-box protein [Azospirillum sp. SYSU D00513]
MSLFHRLVALVLLVLLPITGIEVWNQIELRRAREAEVHQQVARTLGLIAGEYVRLVEGIRQTMVTLRQTRSLRESDMRNCQGLLDRLRPDYPAFLDFAVTDRDGVIRCGTNRAGIGISVADRPHLRAALETGGFVVGEFSERRSDRRPVLPFSLPYRDTAERPAGVLTALLDINWMADYLARMALPPNTSVTLIDRGGIVLARVPDIPGTTGRPLPPFYRPLLDAVEPGTAEMPGLDGVTRILAHAPLMDGRRDLLLVVGFDRNVAFENIDHAMWRSLALAGAVLLLSLLAAWWGGQRALNRPLAALTEVTRRWRAGDRSARAGLQGPPEIAALGRAFDDLADDLDRHAGARESLLAESRQAETRLRAIVDTAADAVVVLDATGLIQSFNPAAERIFGYGAEQAAGKPLTMLVPALDRWRDIGTGRAAEGRRKDGSAFPLELSMAAWSLGGDRFFTALMRDVTDRREADRRIQHSNTLLETVLESIPDSMFVKDTEGHYVMVNADTCRVFALDREQVLGARDRDLFPPEVAAHIEASDRQIMESGTPVVMEEEIFDRSLGEPRLYLANKAALRSVEGRVIGIVGVARDITDRKRNEDSLRAAKSEAERANIAKSKFLAAASHDLRQPVQSLVLFLAALQERLKGTPSERMLLAMEQALDGLRMLLDSLLDVSKLDAGLVVANPTAMPVSTLIGRMAAEYGPRAAAKGLRLRVVGSDAVVHSDPTLLERMLRNLVENALRYTEQGGILIGCRRRGDRLRIEVVDTGIGIAPDRQAEVFEEFFQVGNPERDRSKGLGLGLAVVRRLARLLGHEVRLRSVPGRGSAFIIELPIAARPPAAVAEESAASTAPSGLVMVVDDEELVRLGMQAMIEQWGYQAVAAGSQREALRLLEEGHRPDAILVDYRLRGGETGLAVVGAVHARLDSRIPAAVVTGDTAPERLVEARNGGYRLLHKPVAAGELQKTVVELMQVARQREGATAGR